MITITCPWCEVDDLVAFAALTAQQEPFACPDCGTTVAWADEIPAMRDPAATG